MLLLLVEILVAELVDLLLIQAGVHLGLRRRAGRAAAPSSPASGAVDVIGRRRRRGGALAGARAGRERARARQRHQRRGENPRCHVPFIQR